MNQSRELMQYSDELAKLRSSCVQIKESISDLLLKHAVALAFDQVSCFKTTNDFFNKFSTKSSLKERLENSNNTIVMPDRNSVLNLIASSKAALDIHKELALGKHCTSVTEKQQFEGQKTKFNGFSYSHSNNQEFNRCVQSTIHYYNTGSENEEFGDSTVNTIVSDDVLASSPI